MYQSYFRSDNILFLKKRKKKGEICRSFNNQIISLQQQQNFTVNKFKIFLYMGGEGGFVQVVDHFKNDTKTLKDFPNQSDTTLGLIEHS